MISYVCHDSTKKWFFETASVPVPIMRVMFPFQLIIVHNRASKVTWKPKTISLLRVSVTSSVAPPSHTIAAEWSHQRTLDCGKAQANQLPPHSIQHWKDVKSTLYCSTCSPQWSLVHSVPLKLSPIYKWKIQPASVPPSQTSFLKIHRTYSIIFIAVHNFFYINTPAQQPVRPLATSSFLSKKFLMHQLHQCHPICMVLTTVKTESTMVNFNLQTSSPTS